jgi:hypothetical protein
MNIIPAIRQKVTEKVNDLDVFTRPWYLFFQQVYRMLSADTTVVYPILLNSWVNYGSSYQDAAFYKDPFGYVHIIGLIKNGTINTVAFTLPVGYRPVYNVVAATRCYNGVTYFDAHMDINTNGDVFLSAAGNAWFSLNIPPFRIEQ